MPSQPCVCVCVHAFSMSACVCVRACFIIYHKLVFYTQSTTVVVSERFREEANEKACKVRVRTIYERRKVLGKHIEKLGAVYDKSNARQTVF